MSENTKPQNIKSLSSKETAEVAIESAAEPGVIFNIGNTIANAQQSISGAATNLAALSLCMIIRCASELENRGVKLPLPKFARKLV